MLGRVTYLRTITRSFSKLKPLVATEEFPFTANLTPLKPTAALIKESKLANGVKIITRESNSAVVNIKVAVLGGSSVEDFKTQKGAAHLLAAAAYYGSSKNTGVRLLRYLESLGAVVKSTADREKIVFDVKVLADKVDSVFNGVVTAVASPPRGTYVYTEDVLPLVQTHIHLHEEDPKAQLIELLHEAAFGEESPLGSSQYSRDLSSLNLDEVVNYRNKYFVADNIVVVGSGISHEKLQALVEQNVEGGKLGTPSTQTHIELQLGQFALPKVPSGNTLAINSPYVGGNVKQRVNIDGKSHTGLAFPIPSGNAVKPFLVLYSLLNDRFGAENVVLQNYSKGGLLGVYSSGEAEAVSKELTDVVAFLKSVAADANLDITTAKNKVTLKHLLALEGSNSAEALLTSHLSGTPGASFGDVRSVTAEEVRAAAKSAFKATPSYAVLGVTAGVPSFEQINASWRQ